MFAYVEFPSWINPYVISGLPVRWYGLMYIFAFAVDFLFVQYQCKRGALAKLDFEGIETLFIYLVVGLIAGARLVSCLLYEANTYYWTHPWMIFWPFRNGQFTGLPGMSYHGGVIGGLVGNYLFCRRYGYRCLDVSDTVIAGLPLGYTLGRIGNFINGELWGRITGSSFGMIFPLAPWLSTEEEYVRLAADAAGIDYVPGALVNLPRYPSQLYEAFGEGILLFVLMWFVIKPFAEKKKTGPGLITGAYFALYGIVRFVIEFFREPDVQLGFVFMSFSMGQILCFLMVVSGAVLVVHSFKTEPTVYKVVRKGKHENKRKG